MKFYEAMHAIYAHAHTSMHHEDLQAVGDELQDRAAAISRRMSNLFDGLACMFQAEEVARVELGPMAAGSFRDPSNVYQLLSLVSDQFELVATLSEVGAIASELAHTRRNSTNPLSGEA